MRPLDGFRVLALEHAVAAPLCTRHLADLGAEVIKIERPGGGDFARGYDKFVHGQSSFFVWLNRGKRSLTLDVKHPEGRTVLDRLAGQADVVVQNLAPGAATRLGLGHAALAARNPRVVVCDISGYGESGPYAKKKAYDLLIQAESGIISVTGTETEPSRVGISIADIATGMYAQTAVLAALLRRERSGQGAHVSVAMLEALAEWMTASAYRWGYAGSLTERMPTTHPLLVPYGAHRAKDGTVIFGLQNEREWATFCAAVLGRPEIATDPRFASNADRCAHRGELTGLIEDFLADKTMEEAVALLDRAGIANGRLNTPREVWEHPQLQARNRWREVATPQGMVRALLPPVTFGDAEAAMGAVPALGADTDAVLGELGYAAADIARLHDAGAV
ncbi:MAG: CoA transferase [Rhodospirillales bacterium]|nr:CoA transferase [Rhodospirillales bacterium]